MISLAFLLQLMYLQYLRNLLQQNHIPYKTQAQFNYQHPTNHIHQTHQKIHQPQPTQHIDQPNRHIRQPNLRQQQTNQQHPTQQQIGQDGLNRLPPIPTNLKHPLTAKTVERYSRQMLLKQISYEGQLKLLKAKIGIVGAGGVGCPLGLYLAAAGVGTLGLFDSDVVEISNLHRQVGHRSDRIGMQKTESLKQTLLSINPQVVVNKHPFIKLQTVEALDEYDLVIDGSDNPACRYMVNDYCMKTGKRLLSGACIGWQAQLTAFGGTSLCYRCLWGNQQLSAGGCSTLGVVGMVPGLVGILLAIEAIKLVTKGECGLEGRLLTFDGRKCEFKKLALRKRLPDCIGCGINKLDMQTYDYSRYNQCSKAVPQQVKEMTWEEHLASNKQSTAILDVRPANIYNIVHLVNTLNIPYELLLSMSKDQVLKQIAETWQDQEVPVSCARGVSSRLAVKYLEGVGVRSYSIKGGIVAYRQHYDPMIPQL